MTITALPIATNASSAELALATKSTDSTFQLLYFPLHGRGELIRNILVVSGARWEELAVDWANQKEFTPFQVLPVLYETTGTGTVLELAESLAIERYLGQKYHLFGDNVWEEHLINRLLNNTDGLSQAFAFRVIQAPAENRLEAANKFYTEVLSKWVHIHEEHLGKNGSNGHYVGNKITLADLKTAQTLDRILLLVPAGGQVPVSAEVSPNVWKLRQTVHAHPLLESWRQSQRGQDLDKNTKGHLGF